MIVGRRSHGRMIDAGLAVGAAAMLVAASVVPSLGEGGGATACWLRALAGVECPFCGMSRSFVALAHGDVTAAFGFHPAGPLLALALALFALGAGLALARRTAPLVDRPRVVRAFEGVAVLALLLGIFRGVY